jgi:hypothetical protein
MTVRGRVSNSYSGEWPPLMNALCICYKRRLTMNYNRYQQRSKKIIVSDWYYNMATISTVPVSSEATAYDDSKRLFQRLSFSIVIFVKWLIKATACFRSKQSWNWKGFFHAGIRMSGQTGPISIPPWVLLRFSDPVTLKSTLRLVICFLITTVMTWVFCSTTIALLIIIFISFLSLGLLR